MSRTCSNYYNKGTKTGKINCSKRSLADLRPSVSENLFQPCCEMQDLAQSLRYFLTFGRILGIIPIIGFTKGSVESLKFRWRSLAVVTNIVALAGLTCCTAIGSIRFFKSQNDNLSKLLDSLKFIMFFGAGSFIYAYFLLYSKDFIIILRQWKACKLYYQCDDKYLRRDVHIVASIFVVALFFEFSSFHLAKNLNLLQEIRTNHNITVSLDSIHQPASIEFWNPETWVSYYHNSMKSWSMILTYHPTYVLFGYCFGKLSLHAVNFYDLFLIAMSRAWYGKFNALNQNAGKVLLAHQEEENENIIRWKELIYDHLTLTKLLSAFNEFLSPIILVSYCTNIYEVCTHISNYNRVRNNIIPIWIGFGYAFFQFCHVSFRLFAVSLSSAKVNQHALNVSKILKKCPMKIYSKEIQKFETQLYQSEIGISAFGSFVITKSFMLQMLGVVFTLEIVLLKQNSSK